MMKKLIEQHYEERYRALLGRARHKLKNKQDAEEVVMEAFANALQYISSFDPSKSPFHIWFNTILDNCVKNHMKVEHLHGMSRSNTSKFDEEFEERANGAAIKEGVVAKLEDQHYKNLLYLHLLEGHTIKGAAEISGVDLSTAKRAVKTFKAQIVKKYA